MLTSRDIRLLMELQYSFPLVPKPFNYVAERLGLDAPKIIQRVQELKRQGVIRRIGAVLNYKSRRLEAALVGLSVPDRLIEDLAERLKYEYGVSHNFLREHSRLNMWFVLKRRTLEEIVNLVRKLCSEYSIRDYVVLRSEKTYRLDVKFNLERGISEAKILQLPEEVPEVSSATKLSIDVLKMLYDIDICEEPFSKICREHNINVEELLQEVSKLIQVGVLRDFYAVLNQHAIGFHVNAMIILHCECREDVLRLREPTHIVYRRLVDGTLTYGTGCYLVIHAVSRDLVEEFLAKLREQGLSYDVLYSVRDLLGTVKHDVEYQELA